VGTKVSSIAPDSVADWLLFGHLASKLNRDVDVFRENKNIHKLDRYVYFFSTSPEYRGCTLIAH